MVRLPLWRVVNKGAIISETQRENRTQFLAVYARNYTVEGGGLSRWFYSVMLRVLVSLGLYTEWRLSSLMLYFRIKRVKLQAMVPLSKALSCMAVYYNSY